MDRISLERIEFMHPAVRDEVRQLYTHINSKILGKGVRLRLAYTYRSVEEQNELYAQGRTKLFDNSGKRLGKVTNAPGGKSIHNYGLAFDIVLLLDKNNDGVFEAASWDIKADTDKDGSSDWMEIVHYLKANGWKWGGDFKSIVDPPHFEKTFGLTPAMLAAKISSGKVIVENIGGKTFRWARIT